MYLCKINLSLNASPSFNICHVKQVISLSLKVNLGLLLQRIWNIFILFQPNIVLLISITLLVQILLPLFPDPFAEKASVHTGKITNGSGEASKDYPFLSRSQAKESSYVWCAFVFQKKLCVWQAGLRDSLFSRSYLYKIRAGYCWMNT